MSLHEGIRLYQIGLSTGRGIPEGNCAITSYVCVAPGSVHFEPDVFDQFDLEIHATIKKLREDEPDREDDTAANSEEMCAALMQNHDIAAQVLDKATKQQYPNLARNELAPWLIQEAPRVSAIGKCANEFPTVVACIDVKGRKPAHGLACLGTLGRVRRDLEREGFDTKSEQNRSVVFYSIGYWNKPSEPGFAFALRPDLTGNRAHQILSDVFYPGLPKKDIIIYGVSIVRRE
jgi:hypothetical protein